MAAMGQGGGDGGGEAQGGEGQAQQSGPDLGALSEQLGSLASGQEEMRQFFSQWQESQQQQQQAPAEQEAGSELDLSFLDPAQSVYENPDAVAQRLNDTISGAVDQRAQALIAPMQQQMVEMRREQQARDLAGEFPELADPDMANKIAGRGGLAEQTAAQLGRPELAAEPSFWRLVYVAHKGAEAGNSEQGSGDPGAAHVEAGNGAGPGMSEADLVKQIAESGGRGSSVLDF